jgi:predicted lipoprotein with Yx(FWY)xxD motif
MRQQYIPGSGPLRLAARRGHSRAASGLSKHPRRTGWLALAAVIAAALSVAACGSSSSSSSGPASAPHSAASGSASSASALKTATIDGATVLTNTQGFTLYMFAPDTGTASKCNGSCAQIWPPVTAPVIAGSGITGTLGTIKRADGAAQATYDGHPLYTYAGDTQPGQAKGNGIKGVWHEVTPGIAAAASSPGTGGNGY